MSGGLDDLEIYKLAERLEIYIYKVTKFFPRDEVYRSVDQLRRSSSSVTNNIAESYGRYSFGDKIYRLQIARGEVQETRGGIMRASKKGMLPNKIAIFVNDKYIDLVKGINGYIRYLRKMSLLKEQNKL